MKGAREFCNLFSTGQYGKLYISVGSHARGNTLSIYVVPFGEEFNSKYGRPFNPNAIEVYGIIGGQPGWTESYGWLHNGEWVGNFERLVKAKKLELDSKKEHNDFVKEEKKVLEKERVSKLLNEY